MKKIFVSYSSFDEQIVSLFIEKVLCAGSGVDKDDIALSTIGDAAEENEDNGCLDILMQSKICFLMVSDNYRKCEACLQEMSVAFMKNDVIKKILLLSGFSQKRIGYFSLVQGAPISDADGLDSIHDLLVETYSTRVQTAFWNRCKNEFLAELHLSGDFSNHNGMVIRDDEVMDILDMREAFERHINSYTATINSFTEELQAFTHKLSGMTQSLSQLNSNPQNFTPNKVRNILLDGAEQNNRLAQFFENNIPALQNDFDAAMKYAIMLQQSIKSDPVVKAQNKEQCGLLISSLVSSRDEIRSFRNALSEMVDLDNTYRKSKLRLIKAVDKMLDMLAFCVSRANDYQLS